VTLRTTALNFSPYQPPQFVQLTPKTLRVGQQFFLVLTFGAPQMFGIGQGVDQGGATFFRMGKRPCSDLFMTRIVLGLRNIGKSETRRQLCSQEIDSPLR